MYTTRFKPILMVFVLFIELSHQQCASTINSTACCYNFGSCTSNDDCANTTVKTLASYDISASQLPTDTRFGCYQQSSCIVETPSNDCSYLFSTIPSCTSGVCGISSPSPSPSPSSSSVCSDDDGTGGCCYELGSCNTNGDCDSSAQSYLTSTGQTLLNDEGAQCYNSTCIFVNFNTSCATLDPSVPSCNDNGFCVKALIAIAKTTPPSPPYSHSPSPSSSSVCSDDDGTGGCCYELGSCNTNGDCDSSAQSYLTSTGQTLLNDEGAQCYNSTCIFVNFNTSCATLDPSVPSCNDNGFCVKALIAIAKTTPPSPPYSPSPSHPSPSPSHPSPSPSPPSPSRNLSYYSLTPNGNLDTMLFSYINILIIMFVFMLFAA